MMTTSVVLSSSSSSSRVSGLLLQRFNVVAAFNKPAMTTTFGGRSHSVVVVGGTGTASSTNANIMTTPSSSSKLIVTFRANNIKSTTRTTNPCVVLDQSNSLTFLTPSVAHDHSARVSEMGFPSMPSSFPTPSSLLLPVSDQNHDDNTIITISNNTVLEMMNRNARKPKRANHGARPCSRSSRRKKKDEVGKRRRG